MNERNQEQLVQKSIAYLEEMKLAEHVSIFLNTEYVKSVIQEEFLKLKEKIQHAVELAPDFMKDMAEKYANNVINEPNRFEASAIATFKVNLATTFYHFLKYVSIDESILLEAFISSNQKLSTFKSMTEEFGMSIYNDFVRSLIPVCIAPNTPEGEAFFEFLEKVKNIK